MRRYAAFLRGVSPMVVKMPALKAAFEAAGFGDVRTLLSSGNVLFSAAAAAEADLQQQAETAMLKELGQVFLAIVRPVDALRDLLASDPYRSFRLRRGSKRVVTFLRNGPPPTLPAPIELEGARILVVKGWEAFSAYVPNPKGAIFMRLIERTFGKDVTARTWETVGKVAR